MEKLLVLDGIITDYMVSTDGQIRNYIKNTIVSQYANPAGYRYVELKIQNRKKSIKKGVHQLVAIVFIPNPENKPTVNHKDGVKHNNNLSNLEWATYKENNEHAFINKLRIPCFGECVHFAKYSASQVELACQELASGKSLLEAEKISGIPVKTLSEIRSGGIWKDIAKKYTFPNFKYPRIQGRDPNIRLKIDELALQNMMPREIMKTLNIPFDDERMYKSIRDIKYRLNKVQRLSKADLGEE